MAFLALAIALAAVLAGWVARGNAWMGAHEGLAWGALGVATVAACVSAMHMVSWKRRELERRAREGRYGEISGPPRVGSAMD